jgi:hypothetical protein
MFSDKSSQTFVDFGNRAALPHELPWQRNA